MPELQIIVKDQKYLAALKDTPTTDKLWDALPIEGKAHLWGEEIYFKIPIFASQEPDAQAEVDVGTIAYWPVGEAFCIFFGPTPASHGEKPQAYSPVNILGKIKGDVSGLKEVQNGTPVRLRKAQA